MEQLSLSGTTEKAFNLFIMSGNQTSKCAEYQNIQQSMLTHDSSFQNNPIFDRGCWDSIPFSRKNIRLIGYLMFVEYFNTLISSKLGNLIMELASCVRTVTKIQRQICHEEQSCPNTLDHVVCVSYI